MSDDVELLRQVYALFNGRDIETVLAAMHPEVVWANGMEGSHVRNAISAQLLEMPMGDCRSACRGYLESGAA